MSIYLGPDFLNFYLMYKPKTNIKEEKYINIDIPLFEKLENVKNDFVISKECYSDEFIKDCENAIMLSYCLTESGQDLYANNFYKLINSLPKNVFDIYINKYKTNQTRTAAIMSDYDELLLFGCDKLYDKYLSRTAHNIILLMIGYYFKNHKITFRNPYPEYVTKEFIQKCLDDNINPNSGEIRATLEGIMLKVRLLYKEYCYKLFSAGFKALKEINNKS